MKEDFAKILQWIFWMASLRLRSLQTRMVMGSYPSRNSRQMVEIASLKGDQHCHHFHSPHLERPKEPTAVGNKCILHFVNEEHEYITPVYHICDMWLCLTSSSKTDHYVHVLLQQSNDKKWLDCISFVVAGSRAEHWRGFSALVTPQETTLGKLPLF